MANTLFRRPSKVIKDSVFKVYGNLNLLINLQGAIVGNLWQLVFFFIFTSYNISVYYSVSKFVN